jgi:hypothetical protein
LRFACLVVGLAPAAGSHFAGLARRDAAETADESPPRARSIRERGAEHVGGRDVTMALRVCTGRSQPHASRRPVE